MQNEEIKVLEETRKRPLKIFWNGYFIYKINGVLNLHA